VTLIWERNKGTSKRVEHGLCHEVEFLAMTGSNELSYVEVLWLGELERRTYSLADLKVVKVSMADG